MGSRRVTSVVIVKRLNIIEQYIILAVYNISK
jgi:hypothetical protein